MIRRWVNYRGEKFDLMEATQKAAIGDLLELHRVAGMSVRKIGDVLLSMGEMKSTLDVYDRPEWLEVWPAMLFLCKRKAGHADFTYAEALTISMADIFIVIDSPEEGESGDPKAPDPSTPDVPDGEAETTS